MRRLAIVAVLSFALATLLCYGALWTAQGIAAKQQQQIESTIQ